MHQKIIRIIQAVFISLLILGAFVLSGCKGDGRGRNKDDVVRVFASNYPLAFFAEKIGGEHVRILNLVPENTDPSKWVPGEKELQEIRSAGLILLNGAGYEPWAEKAGLPPRKTVYTTATLEDYFLAKPEKGRHDPDTWLDFDMAKFQAESVKTALEKTLPVFKQEFEDNFFSLHAELNKLNKRMVFISDKLGCDILYLYASRPVYDYMAAAYQIRLFNLDWEPGSVPTDEQWRDLQKSLESKPGNAMLWESPPPEDVRKRLQNDFDIQTVVFNPCSHRPATGDFLSVMKRNVDNLFAYSKY